MAHDHCTTRPGTASAQRTARANDGVGFGMVDANVATARAAIANRRIETSLGLAREVIGE
jgi:hypothetical protein